MSTCLNMKQVFSLLLIFSIVSVGLVFVLRETWPQELHHVTRNGLGSVIGSISPRAHFSEQWLVIEPSSVTDVATDPRDGLDSVTDPRDGLGSVTDPRDGLGLVTDPRDGLGSVPRLVWNKADPNNADSTPKSTQPALTKRRQILLIVAHGRSGTTFLADIFNRHPGVFYIFEPLHSILKVPAQEQDYDKFAANFLLHIFQCDFSMANATRHIGRFYRTYSRVLSSPPFCKYEQTDPRWKRELCRTVDQKHLEHSCRAHDMVVYKILLNRIPGQSIEKLFEVCERARVDCKVIYLIRDIRPLVLSSIKVSFFKEVDKKNWLGTRRFVYSVCETTEKNLYLMKQFQPSLRSRITLVRYEDLTVEPFKFIKYLYEFAGLELQENIKEWILKITQPSLKDLLKEKRNAVSVIRNSSEVLNKWRLLLDSCYVNVIERYCRDVMKSMGYIATQGSVEMLRDLQTPLFTETYQAQNWLQGDS